MAYEKCIAKVAKHLSEKLTPKQVESIVRELEKSAKEYVGDPRQQRMADGLSVADFIQQKAEKMAQDAERIAAMERRNAALNLKARMERRAKIGRLMNDGMTASKALQAVTVGNSKSRLSTAALQHQAASRITGAVFADLESKNLLRIANDSEFEPLIAQELWELSLKDGTPGISGSPEATEIARIMYKYNKAIIARLNKAGADIGSVEGFVVSHGWDRMLLRAGGKSRTLGRRIGNNILRNDNPVNPKIAKEQAKQTWIDFHIPLLDHERTFGGNDPQLFLAEAYDTLNSGKNLTDVAQTDRLYSFKGPGNLAKRMSQHRILHFKDSESFLKSHREYASSSIFESSYTAIRTGAEKAILMEQWGTNPRAAFDADVEWLQKQTRKEANGGVIKRLDLRKAEFSEIDGSVNVAEDPWLAHIAGSIRKLNNMRALGGILQSSFPDIFTRAAAARRNGKGVLSAYKDGFYNIAESFSNDAERKRFAYLTGVGMDGINGHLMTRWGSDDSAPGIITNMQRKFFKLAGANWWNDAQKTGIARALAADLAYDRNSAFANLPEYRRGLLKLYDITAQEWDVIRKSAQQLDDGNHYITADALDALDDSHFTGDLLGGTKRIEQNIAAARQKLKDKVGALIVDQVDEAIPSPGAREMALIHRGQPRGTAIGEFFRFLGQFKSFPITMVTKSIGRELALAGKGDYWGIAHLLFMGMVFGYITITAKGFQRGEKPRDPLSPETIAASLAQSGGLGIIGDLFFGEYDRLGHSFLETQSGPSFSYANDAISTLSAAAHGEDATAKAFNLMINSIPGNNLFYLRGSLNYLFLYDIQESLNPGYLRRMERRMKRDQGREFLFPPSRYRAQPVTG